MKGKKSGSVPVTCTAICSNYKELQAENKRLNKELKIANTFAVSRRKVIAELQSEVKLWQRQSNTHYMQLCETEKTNADLQAKNERLHKNMAFYKCCAMSGEKPEPSSEPYPPE